MKRLSMSRISEWGLLVVLAVTILWKGGKGLESTWLLAILAGVITLGYALKRLFGISGNRSEPNAQVQTKKAEVPPVLWGMVFALIILTIVSYIFSETRNYGLDIVLRNTSLSLLFFWTVRTGLDDVQGRLLSRVALVITLCATAAALIGIAVYVFQPVNRFVGTFFDFRFDTDYWPNAWANFVLIAWPMMGIRLVQAKTTMQRNLLFIALGLVFGGFLLSYSRGGWLSFIAQLLLMVLMFAYLAIRDIRYRRLRGMTVKKVLARFAVIAVIALGLFFGVNALRAQFYDVQSVTEKVTFTASEGTSSIDERSDFWKQALQFSFDRPLFGYGPYSFRFIQPRAATGVLATSDHAHNAILNNAMERGWPAAILGVLIILSVLFGAVKALFTERREWSQEKDATTILLLLGVAGVYMHSQIDYNLQFVGVSIPFWLSLGFLVTPTTSKNGSVSTSFAKWKWSQMLFRFKLLLACLLLFVTFTEGLQLVISSAGRHAEAEGRITDALGWYRAATHEWLSRDLHLSEAALRLRNGDYADALLAVEKYMKENKQDARAWKMKGDILLRMQDYAEAKQALDTAYALGKYTDLSILELLLRTSKDETARADLLSRKLEFDALFSSYADAIERNTHFIALSANVESLMAISRELSALFPTDENRYKLIARKANSHAQEERSTLKARTPGYLW